MARHIALIALFVLLLAGCAGQSTPAAAASPDAVARAFVTALGTWQEPTLRRIALEGTGTEMRLASQRGQWRGWTEDRLGPQTSVEISESTVEGDRASLVVRSLHTKGESGVRLAMQQIDGDWKVEAWDSYRP